MKKLFSGIKKNIFYISLIAGMAVLVTAVGLYNAKTSSNDDRIAADTSEDAAEETLSGKDKNETVSTDSRSDSQTETETQTEGNTTEAGETEETDTCDTEEQTETAEAELTYDPGKASIYLSDDMVIPL